MEGFSVRCSHKYTSGNFVIKKGFTDDEFEEPSAVLNALEDVTTSTMGVFIAAMVHEYICQNGDEDPDIKELGVAADRILRRIPRWSKALFGEGD